MCEHADVQKDYICQCTQRLIGFQVPTAVGVSLTCPTVLTEYTNAELELTAMADGRPVFKKLLRFCNAPDLMFNNKLYLFHISIAKEQ